MRPLYKRGNKQLAFLQISFWVDLIDGSVDPHQSKSLLPGKTTESLALHHTCESGFCAEFWTLL
jgi:hypothetical protein